MESDKKVNIYAEDLPYPPIRIQEKNLMYANAMLANMASANSELSTITAYVYNSMVTEPHFKKCSQYFHGISIVEMRHLHIFGQLAMELGASPRFWSRYRNRMVYWNAGCNTYSLKLNELIKNAIRGENAAIDQYYQQTRWIKDPCIVEILKRIIMDEEKHVALLNQLYGEFCEKNDARA